MQGGSTFHIPGAKLDTKRRHTTRSLLRSNAADCLHSYAIRDIFHCSMQEETGSLVRQLERCGDDFICAYLCEGTKNPAFENPVLR
jgi:hypothetical protein